MKETPPEVSVGYILGLVGDGLGPALLSVSRILFAALTSSVTKCSSTQQTNPVRAAVLLSQQM